MLRAPRSRALAALNKAAAALDLASRPISESQKAEAIGPCLVQMVIRSLNVSLIGTVTGGVSWRLTRPHGCQASLVATKTIVARGFRIWPQGLGAYFQ